MPSILDPIDRERNRTHKRRVKGSPEIERADRQDTGKGLIPSERKVANPSRVIGEGSRPKSDYTPGGQAIMDTTKKYVGGSIKGAGMVAGDVRKGFNFIKNAIPKGRYASDERHFLSPISQSVSDSMRGQKGAVSKLVDWGADKARGVYDYFSGKPPEGSVAPSAVASVTPPVTKKQSGTDDTIKNRAAGAATPKKGINYDKPFWWMDESLGDRRPIHTIRGTGQSWWSPVTGLEYMSPREAYEGMSLGERKETEIAVATRLHDINKIKEKGKADLATASAKPFAQFKPISGDYETEPGTVDVVGGGYYPGGTKKPKLTDKDLSQASEAVTIAMEMKAQTDEAVLEQILKMESMDQQRIWEALAEVAPEKARSVLELSSQMRSK
jgi:hypothetical protein